jgi:Protein of unknown function (DUF1488)
MPLQQGEIVGYNFNRMVVEFTMLNEGKPVSCAISTEALDNLEGSTRVKSDDRVEQFIRLRSVIEEHTEKKFAAGFVEAGGRMVLRSVDFQAKTNQ